MAKSQFDHALNDGKVTVTFTYRDEDPAYSELGRVIYKGVDVTDIVHPEDLDYFDGLIPEKAHEHYHQVREAA